MLGDEVLPDSEMQRLSDSVLMNPLLRNCGGETVLLVGLLPQQAYSLDEEGR